MSNPFDLIVGMACKYAGIPSSRAVALGWIIREIPTGEKVDFYQVGHNASHEFHLGVAKDGTVWKYSVGDGMYPEDHTDFSIPPPVDVHIRKVDLSAGFGFGYIGHY